MAISITQSSKIEFADWLGVLAQPVVAERFFHKIRATPHLPRKDFSEVQGKQHLRRRATLHITKSTQTHAQ
jgi:hypothetical protein